MPTADDYTQEICREANKTLAVDISLAKANVLEVIDDINRRMNTAVLRTSTTISMTANVHTYKLPEDFGKMIEFGEYDSTQETIKVPWDLKSERYFLNRVYGFSTLESSASGHGRIWFFVGDATSGQKQIRVFPAPSESLTARAIYFAKLSEANLHRFGNPGVVKDGVRSRLVNWFGGPQSQEAWRAAKDRYDKGLTDLKSLKRSIYAPAVVGQPREIRERNLMLGTL